MKRVAAQFENLASIYIALIDYNYITPSKIEHLTNLPTMWNVEAYLIRQMSPFVRPVVIANSKEELKSFIEKEALHDLDIFYYIIPHGDAWIRDTGLEWLIIDKKEQMAIDHNFGLWGYTTVNINGDWKFCDQPNEIPKKLATFMNQKYYKMPDWYSGEGGNRSFNGKGTLISNLTCELQRNPTKTQQELEDCFKETFNIKKMIWIPMGVSDDDLSILGPKYFEKDGIPAFTSIGTGGHVDEFCRFINPTTIVLCGLGDPAKYSYKPGHLTMESETRMNLVYNILRNQTDQDGNKFDIIRIPFPECEPVLIDKEDVTHDTLSQLYDTFPEKVYAIPASSYGNFILCNDAIVVSQYSLGCKDEELKKKLEITDTMVYNTFSKYFKKVIQINNLQQNFGGGGLNCTSCDQPMEGLSELPGILFKNE